MASLLMLIALVTPSAASVVAGRLRPDALRPGRVMASACGLAALAAITLLVWTATTTDRLTGLDLQLDRASAILLAAVTSTGLVVASFARRSIDVDPRAPRFFALFGVLVTGSGLVVVPGGPVLLVVGWIASSWALVGLVGHSAVLRPTHLARRRTARSLAVGDLALVVAVAVAVGFAGSDATRDVGATLDELAGSSLLGVSAADIVAVLLVIAGISRSSLVPLHRWLVATLAAPTPVSAVVHAGFVSGAGLLLIRFGPLVLDSAVAVHLAFAVAVATVVVAVGAMSKRADVKGRLAWSTVSQMGFMMVQCTVGAFSSAVFHIVGHGMYKASMFLGAGDAIAASLRSKRRAAPAELAPRAVRIVAAAAIPTAAVGAGFALIPPDVSDGGAVLIAVFSWLTVAHGVWGWMARGATSTPPAAIGIGALGGFAATFAYLGGLRVVEAFLEPSFGASGAGVDTSVLVVVLAAIALASGAVTLGAGGVRPAIDTLLQRTAHPGLTAPVAPVSAAAASDDGALTRIADDATRRAQIRADVARAQTVIAPSWPLTSFVAVNPLGGLEGAGFEQATSMARRGLRAKTHLSLDEFRRDHARGLTSPEDVRWAIVSHYPEPCAMDPVVIGGRPVAVADVIELDLLHGPEVEEPTIAHTAVERVEGPDGAIGELIDLTIAHSAAQYVSHVSSGPIGFAEQWQRDATAVSCIRDHVTTEAVDWLRELGDDPAHILDAAMAASGVADHDRVDELRGHLSRLRGWGGFARWRTEWAHPDETRPALAPIDLAAARAALEAAWLLSHPGIDSDSASADATAGDPAPTTMHHRLDERVTSVLTELGVESPDPFDRAAVERILELVEPASRHAAWLSAQERHVDGELLDAIERAEEAPRPQQPIAQLAFCIDVRSEGLRRHLEQTGPYETLGYAGFFGVPMAVRRLEWSRAEARCPVLVAPSVPAIERPRIGSDGRPVDVGPIVAQSRRAGGATAVHAQTKRGLGAPFVMAEAAGWIAGPVAAARTLVPGARARSHPTSPTATVMELDVDPEVGVAVEQRVDLAEAVLTTMGLTDRFAPLVVLCGHASDNINNPHATALDCGACAGASGQDNARAVAALLNEAPVRDGLRGRGIDIPDETHFLPGLHETVSDRVDLLDDHDVPDTHRSEVQRLVADLQVAAEGQSADRARHLPGRPASVRDRGADWAQIRPEWGLARNAAFVIGPRSMTAGLDLDGRAFLHSYDADRDPDGRVLETIMTAPLVVAHWISSQYYFSTVDPEAFGAGDKLLHNVVGDIGVISGERGDLRVGLPQQSTHRGHDRHHQPVRLLAVVQAPLERVERIIRQNPILTTLVTGSWIRIAARSTPDERWSTRSAEGTWSCEPRPIDNIPTLEYA